MWAHTELGRYKCAQYRKCKAMFWQRQDILRTKGFFCLTAMPSNQQNGSPATVSSLWTSPAAIETPQTGQRGNIHQGHSACSEIIMSQNCESTSSNKECECAHRPFSGVYITFWNMSYTGNRLGDVFSKSIILTKTVMLKNQSELPHILLHYRKSLPQPSCQITTMRWN